MKVCQDHCSYYKKNGKRSRRRHPLKERVNQAKKRGDEQAGKEILDLIKRERERERERERAFWRRVKLP